MHPKNIHFKKIKTRCSLVDDVIGALLHSLRTPRGNEHMYIAFVLEHVLWIKMV